MELRGVFILTERWIDPLAGVAHAVFRFNDRVKEIHASLDAHGIPHAFGGAIALIYGVSDPRLTHDIDLNIAVAPEDVDQVLAQGVCRELVDGLVNQSIDGVIETVCRIRDRERLH